MNYLSGPCGSFSFGGVDSSGLKNPGLPGPGDPGFSGSFGVISVFSSLLPLRERFLEDGGVFGSIF